MFKNGQLVLAQCQNYPFWPGKILEYNSPNNSYKVLFCGQKSYADISADCIITFTEEQCRKITNSNKHNKELLHSIRLALKKHKKRQKNLNESSSQDNFLSEDLYSKVESLPRPKQTKADLLYNAKAKQDPLVELVKYLDLLMKDIMEPSGQSRQVILTAEEEAKLTLLLESNSVSLANLIEGRVVEKMIMIIKAFHTFKLWCTSRQSVVSLIQVKFSQYKTYILAQNSMGEFNLSPLRKENIIVKVNNFKANI